MNNHENGKRASHDVTVLFTRLYAPEEMVTHYIDGENVDTGWKIVESTRSCSV